jgi:ORF6N domain
MFDKDLAELYGVPTKSLNLAVKRNLARFPEDFMIKLTQNETINLRFQSERAVQVNIQIIRAR